MDEPFWRRKRLAEMTKREWESLCDGCGRCCLNKLEEEETDRVYFTDVACRLLDGEPAAAATTPTAPKRERLRGAHPAEVGEITWLPPTCAYRLVAEGRDLYWWHPLVSGDPETVHQAGISVRGRVRASEADVPDEDLEDHIVNWPLRVPKKARRASPCGRKKEEL